MPACALDFGSEEGTAPGAGGGAHARVEARPEWEAIAAAGWSNGAAVEAASEPGVEDPGAGAGAAGRGARNEIAGAPPCPLGIRAA